MRKLKLVMVGNGMAGMRTLEELLKLAPDGSLCETTAEQLKELQPMAALFEEDDLLRMLTLLGSRIDSLKRASQPRLAFELILLRLASMQRSLQVDEWLQQLAGLPEDSLGSLPAKKNS